MTTELQTRKKRALITGASAGIGAAIARTFAQHGYDLVLAARRGDRMKTLADELKASHGADSTIVEIDLAEPQSAKAVFDRTEGAGLSVDALVANAGYTVPGYFKDTRWEDQAGLIQVMVTGVAELNHRFAPEMARRGFGRIINVASLAGHLPGAPGGTLYAASKSFVIKMSESLSLEYQGSGVTVTALCPGFTYSEFHDVAGNREEVSQMPSFMWMDAETVAAQAYDAVEAGNPVLINGGVNKTIARLARFLPHRLAMALMARNTRNADAKPA